MTGTLLLSQYLNLSSLRRAEGPGIGVIVVVAFAVLIALGAALWAGMSIYCMSRGMNLDTGFGWGWVDFSNIRFRCYH